MQHVFILRKHAMLQSREEKILKIILNLESWIKKNGLEGYDPYDLKAAPFVLWITKKSKNSFFYTVIRELLFEIFLIFPKICRKLFLIKKTINPKAIALLSSGYLNLYKITGNEEYRAKSFKLSSWLLDNRIEINGGYGWGYPFNWQSTEFIAANTPNGIVTTAVADVFREQYLLTKNEETLKVCLSIARFLATLPTDRIQGKGLCFSYTPQFINHVHNLNLFIAEFLYKTGKDTGNDEYIQLALDAVKYTLSDQRDDGSFDYNGPPEKPMHLTDHYHTGYVLRMLNSLWKLTSDNEQRRALEKGYTFYLNSFFEAGSIPKFTPSKKYRIDIHSCSESILCITELSSTLNKGMGICDEVVDWTIENLMNKRKTYFYHGIFKSKLFGFTFKSKIAYLRWGQAWMFKALTTYYLQKYAG
jgi:rhamnogalacturonyl hydrolase YesR